MNIKNTYHYNFRLKPALVILVGLLAYFIMNEIAQAAYKDTFVISAYYSPLPGQERYVTGSYDSDIKLNGSGVNSADGTAVYPGMIAAPSSYPFGTKMNIPGVGIVAVHDRGGAIVHAGERGQSFDRLDIWMGYGDKGLSRALNWGKRTVQVTVYGVDPGLKENVYLEGFTEAEKFIQNIVSEQKIFKDDLWFGESGSKVKELQQYLIDLGYYKGKIDGFYGDPVYKAVMQFQIDSGIVGNEEEFGAGYFGINTRREIEAAILKKKKKLVPNYNMGKDDSGDDVKKLQQALLNLGYDVEVNGIYDEKTVQAVFEFQQDNEIVNDEGDLGAGYFGPQTFAVLSDKLVALTEPENESVQTELIVQADYDPFEVTLQKGDSGEEVKILQKELSKLNLLRIEPTGYFGEVTQNAVFKFQQRKGIVASKTDKGSGVFGPVTRNALNGILGYRANTKQLIAEKTAIFNENKQNIYIAENTEQTKEQVNEPVLTGDLLYGSKGEDVETLQQKLKELGYFDGAIITDYFGDVTKNAVISFQLEKRIISSTNDPGAGVVGPQTREQLNTIL